jgi:hypothetical protein
VYDNINTRKARKATLRVRRGHWSVHAEWGRRMRDERVRDESVTDERVEWSEWSGVEWWSGERDERVRD